MGSRGAGRAAPPAAWPGRGRCGAWRRRASPSPRCSTAAAATGSSALPEPRRKEAERLKLLGVAVRTKGAEENGRGKTRGSRSFSK